MRVLVCGGRDYSDREAVWTVLDALAKKVGGSRALTVIQGGARGADEAARAWCYAQPSCHLVNEPADWRTHGKRAGPIRNQKMLDEHRPDLIVAFPGGRGTEDMVRRAVAAGVIVARPQDGSAPDAP